ncbi:MAG: hypothetical protein AAB710_02690 [Patescibacteria group bacterium]
MKFLYKKYGPFLRPVIPIKVKYNNHFIAYEVLVDSGADMCIFDAEIGDLLRVPVEKGTREIVGGIAGQQSHYFIHPVEIEVGGWSYKIKAGFLRNVAGGFNYGVVGQKGFFDIFIVKFDFMKAEIELRHRT